MVGGFTVLVILLAGEVMARSRAGLGLTIVALFGVFALGFANRSVGLRRHGNQQTPVRGNRLGRDFFTSVWLFTAS